MNRQQHLYIKKRVALIFHPFFIFLFFLTIPEICQASYQFNDKVSQAYQQILKLKIKDGRQLADAALKEDPQNGLAMLMQNYAETISLFISDNESEYAQLKINEGLRLKKIINLSKDSPYYLYLQAEIQLQWALVKLKFGEEMNAVWNVRHSLKLLEENHRLYPQFIPNKKSLGLLNIIFGSIPDKFTIAANLVGMKGDIKTGMNLLNEVGSSNNEFALEAEVYKILAENYILKNTTSDLSRFQKIYGENSDNLLITFFYSLLLIKEAQTDLALQTLKSRPTSPSYQSMPYMDFIIGEIYLFKSEYTSAETYYNKFLAVYEGKNFLKDCYYKLFLCHWLSNKEESANLYKQKIRENGQAIYDADKHAQKFAESGEYPNKTLMKARLNFDGGYYIKALETINTFPINTTQSKKDIVEYYYRKGRIYHELNNYSQAIILYLKTIELSTDVNYYFAPNAALQTGYIYNEQDNKELAKIYFNKALSYQDYEYKNSIDNKARAALNELKAKK